jgi:CheY-like chemotaxis protein
LSGGLLGELPIPQAPETCVCDTGGKCSEAIAEIQSRRFDCVTVDLMLEDGDGTEVRSRPQNLLVP